MNKLLLKVIILLSLLFIAAVILIYFFNSRMDICQKNKSAVVKLLDEVWSKGNLKVVDELIAPQYTIKHDPGDPWDGKILDLATYKKRVTLSHEIFPDQKFYIEDLICEGNKVTVSWKFTGTQKGKIPGLPITNKIVTVSGITIYYFSNNKIVGHWQIVDRLGFLGQLGLIKNKPQAN